MWLLINNKVITCDVFQSRNIKDLGWCFLCMWNEEENYHLIMEFYYTRMLWKELDVLMRLRDFWVGNSIEEGFLHWCENPATKDYRTLPLIIS